MWGALAAAWTALAAAGCCLAIPVTVGIIGVSDLAALGANLGVVAVAATLVFAWIIRARSRGEAEASGDEDR